MVLAKIDSTDYNTEWVTSSSTPAVSQISNGTLTAVGNTPTTNYDTPIFSIDGNLYWSSIVGIVHITNGYATSLAANPTAGQILSFNASSQLEWITNSGLTVSTLSNSATSTLNSTAPTTGQALTYDGTDLVWATVGGSTSPSVTNVDIGVGNYTLVLADGGNTVNVNAGDGSSSGYVIYIPDNASVAFPIGTQVLFTCSQSFGSSYNYINGASGVTIIQSSNSLNAGYMRRAVKLDTDTWMISSQI